MAYSRWSSEDAALLLIDHQVGTLEWMHSAPKKDVRRNTLALAKAAAAIGSRKRTTVWNRVRPFSIRRPGSRQ